MIIARPTVLVDALGLVVGKQRGAERFFCCVMENLIRLDRVNAVVVCNKTATGFFRGFLPAASVVTIPISGGHRFGRFFLQTLLLPLLAFRKRASVVFSSTFFPAVCFRCPAVITIYDLLPLHPFDSGYSRTEKLVRRVLLQTSVARADAILTLSKWSAGDIREKFDRRVRGRIHIVPSAAGDLYAQKGATPDQPEVLREATAANLKIILSVLGGKAYKNQVRLVEAFNRLSRSDSLLVIAGDAARILSGIDCGPRVRVLGYVPDEDLAKLYEAASLFVFPSLFEGFGIPVLEAQMFGVPVVCSDIPVLREVAGEGALFADPYSVDSIAAQMERALTDEPLRLRLIAAGRHNAARFTWENSALRLFEALQREAASRT